MAGDVRFGPGWGDSLGARASSRPRLRLISATAAREIGRADRRAEAARRRAHVERRPVGAVLLVPQREDQEAPDVAAVVRLEVGVLLDHRVHVRRVEEALLAEPLL